MSLVKSTLNTSNHKRGPSVDIEKLERTAEIVQDQDLSIESWITQANRLYDQARLSKDKGDLENAYVQYLKFNNIVTTILPQHQVELRKRSFEVSSILRDLKDRLMRRSDDTMSQSSIRCHTSKTGIISPKKNAVSNHAQDLIRKFSAMAGTTQALPISTPTPSHNQPIRAKNSIFRIKTHQKTPSTSFVQEEEVVKGEPGVEKSAVDRSDSSSTDPANEKPALRAPPRPKGSEARLKSAHNIANLKEESNDTTMVLEVKPTGPPQTTSTDSSQVTFKDVKKSSEESEISPLQHHISKKYIPTSVFASYRLGKRKSNAERLKSEVSVTELAEIPSSSPIPVQSITQLETKSEEKSMPLSEHQNINNTPTEEMLEPVPICDNTLLDKQDHTLDCTIHNHDLDLYESVLKFPHIEALEDSTLPDSPTGLNLDIDDVSRRFPSLEHGGSIRSALLNARQAKVRRHRTSDQSIEKEGTYVEYEDESLPDPSLDNRSKPADVASIHDTDSHNNNSKEGLKEAKKSPLKPARSQNSQYSFKSRTPSRRWPSSVSISQTNFAFPHATVISTNILHRYLTLLNNPPSILLMDIRPRDVFLKGHIEARYIINIDPTILKNETTSSKIEAALLVCSKKEQALFNERHKFDLIVFYDQSSTSLTQRPIELGGSLMTNPLQHLVSAIYEREFERVLIRMPVLLNGGYEAWIKYRGETLTSTEQLSDDTPTKVSSEDNICIRQIGGGIGQVNTPKTEPKRNVSGDWFDKLQGTYSQRQRKNHLLKRNHANSSQMDLIAEKLNRSAVITPAIGRPIALEIYDYFQQNPIPSQRLTYQPATENHSTSPDTERQHTSHHSRSVQPRSTFTTGQGQAHQQYYAFPPRRSLPRPQQSQESHDARVDSSWHLAPQAIVQQPQIHYPPRILHPVVSTAATASLGPQQYPAYPPHPNPSQNHQMKQTQQLQAIETTQQANRLQLEQCYPSTSSQVQKISPDLSRQQVQPSQATPLKNVSKSNLRRRNTFLDNPYYGFTTTNSVRYDPPPPVPKRPLPLPPVVSMASTQKVSQQMPPALQTPGHQWQQRTLPIHTASPTFESSVSQLGSVRIGITGLKNLGNTCFMNSILQCLSATVPLARYFLDGSYKRHINTTNFLGTGGILAQAFGDLIRVMWSEQYTFVSPITFRDAIARFAPQFKGSDQQDSQELLGFLLDGLHEDLNLIVTKPPPDNNEDDDMMEKMPEHLASNLAWEKYLQRNSSIIVSLFQGQFRSRLQCTICNQTSTTYNPFMNLSLPIPSVNQGVSLSACLDEFVKEEILDGDDAWFCSRCKTRRRAIKRLTLSKLPDILLIHLKRFSFSGPFRDKLDTFVSYPLRKLDMRPYLPPTQSKTPAIYDLYAVSNHFGGLNGGHYTAQVRNGYRNQWHNFDDSRVSACDERAVVCKSAYILFYVRTTVS